MGGLDHGRPWWDGWSCPKAIQPWHLLWVSLSTSTFLEEILALAEVFVDFATGFIPSPYLFFLLLLETGCSELPLSNPESRLY